jgi:hypothetical protein
MVKRASDIVGSLLETEGFRAPDDIEAQEAPPPAPTPGHAEAGHDAANAEESGLAAIVASWRAGRHEQAAQMVLRGLPSYLDLVRLIFALGQEGAIDLARLMDGMSENGGTVPEASEDQVPLENPPLE